MEKVKDFLKKEVVLVVTGSLTLLSMFFTPPSAAYFDYIDFKVLSILFCLMAVIEGFKKSGVFNALSTAILSKYNNTRTIGTILTVVCFFTAMFVTNDVALITFVPFTMGLLNQDQDDLIVVIVMETVAANLGSMMTPVGNPQNLFLYEYYKLDFMEFVKIMLPLGIISFILIILLMLLRKGKGFTVTCRNDEVSPDKGKSLLYGGLFMVCLLTVLHILSAFVCFVIITVVIFFADKDILRKPDYMLLLTFVFFFIFTGNISAIEKVRTFTEGLIAGREMIASAFISQVISNVPAAVMLAPFTGKCKQLLLGVNIGGLGTPVASLASLISYKIYSGGKDGKKAKYIGVFSLINFVLLFVLLWIAHLL